MRNIILIGLIMAGCGLKDSISNPPPPSNIENSVDDPNYQPTPTTPITPITPITPTTPETNNITEPICPIIPAKPVDCHSIDIVGVYRMVKETTGYGYTEIDFSPSLFEEIHPEEPIAHYIRMNNSNCRIASKTKSLNGCVLSTNILCGFNYGSSSPYGSCCLGYKESSYFAQTFFDLNTMKLSGDYVITRSEKYPACNCSDRENGPSHSQSGILAGEGKIR